MKFQVGDVVALKSHSTFLMTVTKILVMDDGPPMVHAAYVGPGEDGGFLSSGRDTLQIRGFPESCLVLHNRSTDEDSESAETEVGPGGQRLD